MPADPQTHTNPQIGPITVHRAEASLARSVGLMIVSVKLILKLKLERIWKVKLYKYLCDRNKNQLKLV